jgi:hypothetical protein
MSERSITDADAAAIAKCFHELHICRFNNIAPEDMAFMKDLLNIYKETRSEVIKWLIRGIVYGSLLLVTIGAYFKVKGIK